jgi:GH24 family phage-related lysozyme (muramidase)/murein DD-endopeptidase MepM/ murein hydrolase activator NlpD
MKQILAEELKRMHTIIYGEQIVEQEDFISSFLKGLGFEKEDDPEKADLVDNDVQAFYDTLESAAEGGGISEQQAGGMEYQKDVESMQIGLILLGYDLPRFGVDGLFGPETANAVKKFTNDHVSENGDNNINETVELVGSNTNLIGRPGQGTHSASGWANNNAWDVAAPVGTDVRSLTSGTVSAVKKGDGTIKKSGVKKIYGDQVIVKSNDGPEVFYTHIECRVNQGDSIQKGDVIGKIMTLPGMPSHVHVALSYGNLSDYTTGLSNATGGSGSSSGMAKASKEMLLKMVELLKSKNITSEDLKKLVDPLVGRGNISLSGSWVEMTKQLLRKYETFSDTASWDENAYRGGYGSGKKLVNGKLVDVTANTTWTLQEAEDTLDYELKNTYGPIVANQLGISNWEKLNDKQKASLVSLGYNAGPYYLTARDYGKNIKNAIENGDMEAAAAYIASGPTTGASTGRSYSSLARRRAFESEVFLS